MIRLLVWSTVMVILLPRTEQLIGTRMFSVASRPNIVEGERRKFVLSCISQDLSVPQPKGYRLQTTIGRRVITHINSIAVVTDPERLDIASIKYNYSAVLGPDGDGATVTGDLSEGQPGNFKYIEVTWMKPTRAQAKNYGCAWVFQDWNNIVSYDTSFINIGYIAANASDV